MLFSVWSCPETACITYAQHISRGKQSPECTAVILQISSYVGLASNAKLKHLYCTYSDPKSESATVTLKPYSFVLCRELLTPEGNTLIMFKVIVNKVK